MAVHTPPDLRSVEHALEQLFRLSMGRRGMAEQSAAVGATVSRAGYAVLRTVDAAGRTTMGALARASSMDPAVAARQVGSLEAGGMLRTSADPEDGRVRLVELTSAGAEVLGRIIDFRTAYLSRVLATWSQDERSELVAVVDRLVDDLRAVPLGTEEP